MTCKDCLHLHVCKNLLETMQIVIDENSENREKHCKTFENREEYVNLPVFPTIKMLDKQMPKKPDFEGDGYDDSENIIYDTWICPCCENRYEVDYDMYQYCPACGQALDWSDYE